MKPNTRKPLASTGIEAEIAILRDKLRDHEHQHAAALEAFEGARAARRAVLTKDATTIEAATKKVRQLQLAADDAGSLVQDYRMELAAAELRLADAMGDEKRDNAAATLRQIAATVSAHIDALSAAVASVVDIRRKILDAIPEGVGLLPGYHSHRPSERQGNRIGPLSAQELIDATIVEGFFHLTPEMFDQFSDGLGSRFTITKLMDIRKPQPSYVGDRLPGMPLAEAADILLVKPAEERARRIRAGEIEPVLGDIKVIDRANLQEMSKMQIVATKRLTFIAPKRGGVEAVEMYAGESAGVVEPIARLAIAKRAALDASSPAAASFRNDLEKRKDAGLAIRAATDDVVDLGDPMGCLQPANDDDEIAEEVARVVG